jgi:hypothetical protein
MKAPFAPWISRWVTLALLLSAAISTTGEIAAQSARTAMPIPLAISIAGPDPDSAAAPNCSESLDGPAPRDPSANPQFAATMRDSILASIDPDSELADTGAASPGVGMVIVDPHGTIVASGQMHVAPVASTTVQSDAAPRLPDGITLRAYTASSGSVVRTRCAHAMNPPPSSRSPL